MKKLLAVFLALMMILSVSLMACSDKKENENNEEENENEFVPNSNKENTGTTEANQEEDPEGTRAPVTSWTGKTGTVYVCANNTNIRAAASTEAVKFGSVDLGYTINYTDFNGEWYKFSYNGKDAYISAAFTDNQKNNTTFSAPTTVAENSVIHIKTSVKSLTLRSDPCMENSSNIIKGYLDATCTANGEMTVLEVSDSGLWVKVKFKGKDLAGVSHDDTFYCGASYIQEFTSSGNGGGGNG